jgi:hypothetical protein
VTSLFVLNRYGGERVLCATDTSGMFVGIVPEGPISVDYCWRVRLNDVLKLPLPILHGPMSSSNSSDVCVCASSNSNHSNSQPSSSNSSNSSTSTSSIAKIFSVSSSSSSNSSVSTSFQSNQNHSSQSSSRIRLCDVVCAVALSTADMDMNTNSFSEQLSFMPSASMQSNKVVQPGACCILCVDATTAEHARSASDNVNKGKSRNISCSELLIFAEGELVSSVLAPTNVMCMCVANVNLNEQSACTTRCILLGGIDGFIYRLVFKSHDDIISVKESSKDANSNENARVNKCPSSLSKVATGWIVEKHAFVGYPVTILTSVLRPGLKSTKQRLREDIVICAGHFNGFKVLDRSKIVYEMVTDDWICALSVELWSKDQSSPNDHQYALIAAACVPETTPKVQSCVGLYQFTCSD